MPIICVCVCVCGGGESIQHCIAIFCVAIFCIDTRMPSIDLLLQIQMKLFGTKVMKMNLLFRNIYVMATPGISQNV